MRATRMGATMNRGQHFATPLHFEATSAQALVGTQGRDGFRARVCTAGLAALLGIALTPAAAQATDLGVDLPSIDVDLNAPSIDGSGNTGGTDTPSPDPAPSPEPEPAPDLNPEPPAEPDPGDTGGAEPTDPTDTPDDVPTYEETYPNGATGSTAASPEAFADPYADATPAEAQPEPVAEAAPVTPPTITGWSVTDRVVSGTTLAGATVQALGADGSVLAETVADEAGAFSLTLPEGVDIADVNIVALGADGTASAPMTGVSFIEQQAARERARVSGEVATTVSSLARNIDEGLAGTNLYSGYAQPEAQTLPILPYALGAGVGVLAVGVAAGVFLGVRRTSESRAERQADESSAAVAAGAAPAAVDLGTTGELSPAPGIMPGIVGMPVSSAAPGTTAAVAPITAPAPAGYPGADDRDLPTEAWLAVALQEGAGAKEAAASTDDTVETTGQVPVAADPATPVAASSSDGDAAAGVVSQAAEGLPASPVPIPQAPEAPISFETSAFLAVEPPAPVAPADPVAETKSPVPVTSAEAPASLPADDDDLDDLERLALAFSASAPTPHDDPDPDPDDHGPRGAGRPTEGSPAPMDTLANMSPLPSSMPPASFISRASQGQGLVPDLAGLDAFEQASVSGAGDGDGSDPLYDGADWQAIALAELADDGSAAKEVAQRSLDATSGDTEAYLAFVRSTMPRTPVEVAPQPVASGYVAPVVGPSTPSRVTPMLRDAAQRARIEQALSMRFSSDFSDRGGAVEQRAYVPAPVPTRSHVRVSSLSVPLVDAAPEPAVAVPMGAASVYSRYAVRQAPRGRAKASDDGVPIIQRAAAGAPSASYERCGSAPLVPAVGDLVDPLYDPTTRLAPLGAGVAQTPAAAYRASAAQAGRPSYIPASPLPRQAAAWQPAPAPVPVVAPTSAYAPVVPQAPSAPQASAYVPPTLPRVAARADGRSTYVPAIGDTGTWDASAVQPVGPAVTDPGVGAWEGALGVGTEVWPVAAPEPAAWQTGGFVAPQRLDAVPAVYGANEDLPRRETRASEATLSPAYIDYLVRDEFAHRHDSPSQRAAATGQFHVIDGLASGAHAAPVRHRARHMA